MRLFIAVDLAKEIKDYLFDLQKKVKDSKITWVSKKHLHLTLKFLGDVEEARVEEIRKAIRINSTRIKANLGHLGFFPDEKFVKVLWVSIEPEDGIIQLQQRIDGELLTLFPSEQKFKSHVTLGRVKKIRRRDSFFESVKGIDLEKKEFVIDSFQLVKSELTRSGPIYEVLENVQLS